VHCFYPLIEALEPIYLAHTNATWLFVVRQMESWVESMEMYRGGIWEAWKNCRTPSIFPGLNATRDDLFAFYEWHKNLIRTFAREHPSVTYIELPLEGETTANDMEEHVGIPARCWGHFNQQENH